MSTSTEGLTASRDLSKQLPGSIAEFEIQARAKISPAAYDFFSTGVADEITLRANDAAFDNLSLKPRVLVDVSRLDTTVELFGHRHQLPLLLAPTALHRLAHPEAELATVRGAAEAGVAWVASCLSSATIEEICEAARTPVWFQLFIQKDRAFTRKLIERAETAGCQALCITVDMPVIGPRRTGLAPKSLMGNFNVEQMSANLFDPSVTWDVIDWVRSFTKIPIILKGILSSEDASLAVERGAQGIIVSNHGARQLDTVPPTIAALPPIAAAVAGRIPVLFDGGVRRGTDIFKALALGADAILLGRPYLWGLAVGGAEGVRQIVQILRNELEITMALCGTPRLVDIDTKSIW